MGYQKTFAYFVRLPIINDGYKQQGIHQYLTRFLADGLSFSSSALNFDQLKYIYGRNRVGFHTTNRHKFLKTLSKASLRDKETTDT